MRITESQLRKIVIEEILREDKGNLYDYELAILAYMQKGGTEEEDIRINAGQELLFGEIPRSNFAASIKALVRMGYVTTSSMSGDARASGHFGRMGAIQGIDVDLITLTPKGKNLKNPGRWIGR